MRPLREYWKRLFSGSKEPGEAVAPDPGQLEREISAVNGENRALADAVERFRADFEHTRDEENQKIADLQQVRLAMEQARDQDHHKLSELETSNRLLQTERDADSKKIRELEQRLAEIETDRSQLRSKVRTLEDSLAETAAGLDKADGQIRQLEASSVEQAQQVTTSLQETGNRITETAGHVKQMEDRLWHEREEYQSLFENTQAHLRRQDSRMSWAITAAMFAMVLGAVAGAILIWDVQKNAKILAGMSSDIKELMAAMDTRTSGPVSSRRVPVLPALPAQDPVAAEPPESVAVVQPEPQPEKTPAPSTPATITKSGSSNPYFLSSAIHPGSRPRQTEGLKQTTRSEVDAFFEQNAKNEGVVTMPNGAQYRVVSRGTGRTPRPGDKVVVQYVGIKLDGTIFDETYTTDEPSTFSMNELMPGWQEVLLKMEEGAEFELYLPPALTTRGSTRKRNVLGQEPSIYLVELLQVLNDGATEKSQ